MNFKSYSEITLHSTFQEVNDALYAFESPFYTYCASGAGCNPSVEYPGWNNERGA